MGIFDFFKNKGKDTQKELTLEDCIIPKIRNYHPIHD